MDNDSPGEIPTIVALEKVPPLGEEQENMRLIKWNQSSRNLGIFVPPGRRVYLVQVKEDDIPAGYVIHYGLISKSGKLSLLCFKTKEKVDTSFKILAVMASESIHSVEFAIMQLHPKLRGDEDP